MTDFGTKEARSWILASASAIEREASRLGDLDAAIGDGDHGANMTRGFSAVLKKLDAVASDTDLGGLFKTVGMTLLSTVGGASGPLYGGFFLALGKQTQGQPSVTAGTLVAALEAGLADIRRRGKAEPGDKTMVDAFLPALEAMAQQTGAGEGAGDLVAATHVAAEAARKAAGDTAPLLARKGRASYLGERSIGHEDPGANSTALLMEALAETCAAAA